MTDSFQYARGAPIYVDLIIENAGSIDPTSVTVQMVLKPMADYTNAMPTKTTAAVATFDVAFNAGTDTTVPFWRASIPANISETLICRNYTSTAWLFVDGVCIQTTDPVYITIYESNKP